MADLTPEALAAEIYQAAWRVCRAAGLFVIRWEDLTDPEQPRPAEAVAVTNGWLAAARTAIERLAPAHAALTAERDCYRGALEAITELASAAKPVMWWSGTRSECAWTLDQTAVTAIAREALEGGR
jgi:hypothetical protein